MKDNDYKEIEKHLVEDEQIALFLQGKMGSAEEQLFMAELKQNNDLRQRAISQAYLIKGMKQSDDEMLQLIKQQSRDEIYKIVGIRRPKKYVRWLAVAASIVLIAFVGLKSYDYYDTVNLGKQYANTFPVSTIIRGEADEDVENELTDLFNKVANGEDLDNTTARLDSLWQLSKQDVYNGYTNYAPYIGWNLSIAYLQNYNKNKAKKVLEEMAKQYPHDTPIGDRIKELLNRL